MSKYSIPDDHEWADEKEQQLDHQPVHVDRHEVDVILTTDPHEKYGYGREKYTAHLSHDEDGATCLYFTEHRWKGNFWRETTEWDWQDVPGLVKRQVAAVVDCDGVDDLDPGHRLVDEGGESTWIHPEEDEE